MKIRLTSVIVPAWNALKYTKMCLDSLKKYTPEPYEVIVVDNGSSDGTKEYLQKNKNIRCIFNKKNLGFAGGINQGLKVARGEHLLLLNNDVILTYRWLKNMQKCLLSSKRIGLVGPRSNLVGGQQGKMGKLPYNNLQEMDEFARNFNRVSNPKKWFSVKTLSGFCLLMCRTVMEKIGLLDERYNIGTREDRDYCLRAHKKGYILMCAGDTFVYHFGHRTFQANNLDVWKIQKENMKLFQEKWGHRG